MIFLLIVGLVGLALAALYIVEGSTAMMLLWGVIGIVSMAAYLVGVVKSKLEKD